MFPDQQTMNEILQAFKTEPSIPKQYKENARTGYEGNTYIVIGANTKFHVFYENGVYHFQMGSLFA